MLSRNKFTKFISEALGDSAYNMSTDGKGTVVVSMDNGNKASFKMHNYELMPDWKAVIEMEIAKLKVAKKVVANGSKNEKA